MLFKNQINFLVKIWCPFLILLIAYHTLAKELPIPRFSSIKANEVNVRKGPGTKNAIEWIFVKKGEPVEIIGEFDNWRLIKDITGEEGWVHCSVLSSKRFVIILGPTNQLLRKSPESSSSIIAYLAPKLRCGLSNCKNQWCKINCQGHNGWVTKSTLWGVHKQE